jgi:hypothetical protein
VSGVFLSYSRGDRGLADKVIRGLRPIGVDVWWDEDMPGVDWQDELARQIQQLAAVVVIWTPISSASKNVRDEARLGQHTEKLVNALFGVTAPPFPFDRTNGLPLDGWSGREPHRGWTRLVQTIEERLVAAGEAKPGQLMAAQTEREATIRAAGEQIAAAERQYQAAKAGEERAADAVTAASAALETAEELLRLVVDRRASGPVLRASQTDVETAREALALERAQKAAAAAALAEASLGLTRARTELERFFDAAPPASQPPASPLVEDPAPVRAAAPDASSTEPERARPSPVAQATPAAAAATPRPKTATAPSAASALPEPRPADPRAPRKPIPAWAPVAGVAAVAVVGLLLFLGLHRSAPAAAAVAAAKAAPAPALAAAATPAADPTGAAAQALVGDWSGNGAACWSNPFRIAVAGSALKETLSGTPSTGAITGLAGQHAVRVKFPGDADPRGDQVYAVAGDTLTVTISKDAMTYQRCRS